VTAFHLLPALVACIAVAACTDPQTAASRAAASSATHAAEKPAPYKKPPRLNGRGEVKSISLEEFFLLHQSDQVLVFDARPRFFYRLGHIPGAVSLPLSGCDEMIHRHETEIRAALASGKTLVTYCTGISCPDARSLARHLSGFGYPASIFSGGWHAWRDAGLSGAGVFSPSPSPTPAPAATPTPPQTSP
jgi:rhodanese-related sulfurtransferase